MLLTRGAFARTAIAPAAAMTATTALAFLSFLHRRPRFTRRLVGSRFTGLARRLIRARLTLFPRLTLLPGLARFPRRAALLLVAALLVHVTPGTLTIRALAFASLDTLATRALFTLPVRTRLARRTISAGSPLVAATRLLAFTALARTAIAAPFSPVATA